MQKLDEKISRYEVFLAELGKDRQDFQLSRVAVSVDDQAEISKAWVRDFDVAIDVLTSMLNDWKDLNA